MSFLQNRNLFIADTEQHQAATFWKEHAKAKID